MVAKKIKLPRSYTISSPTVVDLKNSNEAVILIGSDRLYAWYANGSTVKGFPLEAKKRLDWPMFGGDSGHSRNVENRFLELKERGDMGMEKESFENLKINQIALLPKNPKHRVIVILNCDITNLGSIKSITLFYKADWDKRWHPVPMVLSNGKLVGIFQPLSQGTKVKYFMEAITIKGERRIIPGYASLKYFLRHFLRG